MSYKLLRIMGAACLCTTNDKLTWLGLEVIKGLTDDLKGKVQFLVKKAQALSDPLTKGRLATLLLPLLASS